MSRVTSSVAARPSTATACSLRSIFRRDHPRCSTGGRLLTHRQADRLYPGAESGHRFLFILNERYVIDANVGGNVALINHSCAPNCRAVLERIRDRRRDRVLIETLRPIRAGEELTHTTASVWKSGTRRASKRIWACRCGRTGLHRTMLNPNAHAP